MAEFTDLDEIWFVVTPKSPFKAKESLLENHHRYQMVYEAIKDYPSLHLSDIEFKLPQPNYTIDTLTRFCLIMGEDNLKNFHKWKNFEAILQYYPLYIYPRISKLEVPDQFKNHPGIRKVEAPVMEVSATFIRKQHKAGKNIRPLLPEAVWRYMDEMNFYR